MLKIKEVDVFSLDTIKTGLRVYFTTFFFSIPLAIIPLGIFAYFNMVGWVAADDRKIAKPKFLSPESLAIGWSIEWRFWLLISPVATILIILLFGDVVHISDGLKVALFVVILLSSCVLATGWSVERVANIRQQMAKEPENSAIARKRIVKSVILSSWDFFKRHWVKLLLLTALTYGLAKAITVHAFPEDIISDTNQSFWILLQSDLYKNIGPSVLVMSLGGAVLKSVVVQAIINDKQSGGSRFIDAFKHIIRKLPLIITLTLLYSIIVGIGLILIVPGAAAVIWFVFIIPIVIVENKRHILTVFKRSIELVHGHFWQLTALALPLFVPLLAVVALEPVSNIPSAPSVGFFIAEEVSIAAGVLFSYLFSTFAYLRLTEINTQDG